MGHGGGRGSIADHFLGALQHRDFRTLWVANVSGGAAAWALIVARGWEAFSLSGSSVWVGLVTFAAMIPLFLVPPIAGLLADRIDRRALLAASFGINLAHILALAALALVGSLELWHLVVLGFINGVGRSIQMPATQALLPNLVPRERLLNAIALNQATQHGSRLTGPLLILPLLATVGVSGAFIACTVFYLVGLTMVLRIRTSSTGVIDPEKSAIGNLLEGAAYVYRDRLLRSLFTLVVLHCLLTMSFESMLPVLSQEKLGAGNDGVRFSLLMMGIGAGALVVVLALAGTRGDLARGRLLLVLGVASGLEPIGLAVSPNLSMALLFAVIMGGTQAGFMTITGTIVQSVVPDAIRGRVMSLYLWHIGGVMAVANLAYGSLADSVGAPVVLTVTGAIFAAVGVASVMRVPLRELYLRGAPAGAVAG